MNSYVMRGFGFYRISAFYFLEIDVIKNLFPARYLYSLFQRKFFLRAVSYKY